MHRTRTASVSIHCTSTDLFKLTSTYPWWRWKNPFTRMAHWMDRLAIRKLNPTAPNPYFFRKVMRKPKPMKIITWTSWNTAITGKLFFLGWSYFILKARTTISQDVKSRCPVQLDFAKLIQCQYHEYSTPSEISLYFR